MFHPDTQFLIDHWTSLSRRPEARAGIPNRAALRPDALGFRLPRAFMLERTEDEAIIRLAGSWIEAFHAEPLNRRDMLQLWTETSREPVRAALSQAVREGRPVVVAARVGMAEGPVEVAFAPLRGPSGRIDRLLGLYAPLKTLGLASDESRLLTARVSVAAGSPSRAPLSLAAVAGRRIA